jgi:hypothetical protein
VNPTTPEARKSLPEGRVRKAQVFRNLRDLGPHGREFVTVKSHSLDATPAQHDSGGSVHYPNNRCAVLVTVSTTKPRDRRLPALFLPDMGIAATQFSFLAQLATVMVIPPSSYSRGCVARRRLSCAEAELLSGLLPEGKVRKAQVFRNLRDRGPHGREFVTVKSHSLDATPAQHDSGGSVQSLVGG